MNANVEQWHDGTVVVRLDAQDLFQLPALSPRSPLTVTARYRLRLRDTDDEFFRSNILDDFLPKEFRLAGLAAEAAGEVNGAGAACSVDTLEATPLENETWWRLYENASFLRIQLDKFVSEGLNLQVRAYNRLEAHLSLIGETGLPVI